MFKSGGIRFWDVVWYFMNGGKRLELKGFWVDLKVEWIDLIKVSGIGIG